MGCIIRVLAMKELFGSDEHLFSSRDILGNSGEEEKKVELTPITPYSLMEANQSAEAGILREEFDWNRSQGNMILNWECPDARNWRLLGAISFYFHTIANGGDPKMLRNAANSVVTKGINVIAHDPCGGLVAKMQQVSEGIHSPENDDLSGYVSGAIHHPSELQAGIQAKELAELTDKEVAAMVRNHEDGTMSVIAVFNRTDGGPVSHFPQEVFTSPDTQKHYSYPHLSPEELPEEWQTYMKEYNKKREELLRDDPDVLERVKIHNPQAFALKTDLRAGEIWMPGIAKPGTIFRMTSPRDRIRQVNGEKKTILNPSDLRLVWRQAEYVVSHAIENRGISEAPFRDTDTFIIATPEYSVSQQIGLQFAQQPFGLEWLQDERNKVITLQNNSGILHRAAEMRFSMRDGLVTGFEEVNTEIA